MKQLELNVNFTSLSKKIYWKIFHEVSPAQNSIPALKWPIYGPSTLQVFLYYIFTWQTNDPTTVYDSNHIDMIGATEGQQMI